MSKYLLKRLVLIAVTWFGISLICFLMMRLAPGDPAAMKAKSLASGRAVAVSEYVLKKNRELFYLDRPEFVNWSPETRVTKVAKTLAALRAKEKLERDDARADLVSIGTAGLDLMMAELPQAVARAKAERDRREALFVRLEKSMPLELAVHLSALSSALPGLGPRLDPGEPIHVRVRAWLAQKKTLLEQAEQEARALLEVLAAVGGKSSPELPKDAGLEQAAAAWAAWWEQKRPTLGEDQVASAVTTWLDRGEIPAKEDDPPGPALEALDRVGTLAAPSLMDAYRDAPEGSPAERQAAWGLARVCRKPWDLTTTATERRSWEVEWEEKTAGLEADSGAEVRPPGETPEALADAIAALDARVSQAPGDPAVRLERARALLRAGRPADALEDSERARELAPPPAGTEPASLRDQAEALATLARRLAAVGPKAEWVAAREAEEMELHRYRWSDWWYRAEEQYVDFGAGRQFVRAFTQTQFGRWMGRFLRLDFGESYKQKRPVSDILLERLPRTLTIEAISIFLAYLVAIPLGVYSATHHGRTGDRLSTVVLFLLYSIPTFWAGAMCIWLLTPSPFPAYHFSSLDADKLSTGGKLLDIAWHLVLPVLILTYGQLAYISRQMRTGMLESIRQDYVRTARAKGLSEGVVVYKHALRNALIPILTLLGSTLPVLYAGSVIIETVFTIDGLGKLYFDAIQDRDYPVIMANLVISALLTLVGYLLSDIAYAVVDPRIEFR